MIAAATVTMAPSPQAQIYVAVEPPPGPIVRHYIQHPIWLEQPGRGVLAEAYPEAARAAGPRGEVSLECIVSGAGQLSCRPTSETPPNLGFAEASIQIARRYRMAAEDRNGESTAGAWVVLSFVFSAPR